MHIYNLELFTVLLYKPAQTIRLAREKKSMNQQEFAQHLGKTQSVLSRYENGKVNPPNEIYMHCMHIISEEKTTSTIEQLINKVYLLDEEQYSQLRNALCILIDKCLNTSKVYEK